MKFGEIKAESKLSVQQCSNLYNLSTTSKILVQVWKVWQEGKNKFALIFQSFELEKFGTSKKLDPALIFRLKLKLIAQMLKSWWQCKTKAQNGKLLRRSVREEFIWFFRRKLCSLKKMWRQMLVRSTLLVGLTVVNCDHWQPVRRLSKTYLQLGDNPGNFDHSLQFIGDSTQPLGSLCLWQCFKSWYF